jgi:2-C-methyl-D-erythritol 2,4-cyclodiphosphate synthase
LGAAAFGDIGELFPDSAAENKDRDSAEMLRVVMTKVRQAGFKLLNVDCILFAERPKISPFKQAIEGSIAETLEIDSALVNVKAKTGEGLGDVGARKCMMAQCAVLLYRTQPDE